MTETDLRASPTGDTRTIRVAPPLRRRLIVSFSFLVVFFVYTLLVVNWQPFIRLDETLNRNFHVQSWWPVLHIVDHVGQRLLCVTVLFAICGYVSWRHRSLRPVALCVTGVFLENLVVLLGKLALSRGHPLDHSTFFSGNGDDYPSGHSANVIVVYGLCYWLLARYGLATRRARQIYGVLVGVLTLVMFTTSLLLRWHWFSDLMAGVLVGGAVLVFVTGVDQWVTFSSPLLEIRRAEPAADVREPPDGDLDAPVAVEATDDALDASARPWDVVARRHARDRAGEAEPVEPVEPAEVNGSASNGVRHDSVPAHTVAGRGASNGAANARLNGSGEHSPDEGNPVEGSDLPVSRTPSGSPAAGADRPSRR